MILLFHQMSVCLIVVNLSVIIAFFFRIGTEETAALLTGVLESIITIGSKSLWLRVQHDPLHLTVIDIETTTIELNNLVEVKKEPRISIDTEALPKMPTEAVLLADV